MALRAEVPLVGLRGDCLRCCAVGGHCLFSVRAWHAVVRSAAVVVRIV